MRIRKNTKLSSLLFPHVSGGKRPQTHVCHLNQSPWDVIPFSSSSAQHQDPSWYLPSSSSSSPYLQFDGEDSFNGNMSLGDSVGAVESVASMEKPDLMDVEDNEKSGDQATNRFVARSQVNKSKTHDHDWSLKSGGSKRSDQAAPASTGVITPPRRGRPRGSGKKAGPPASNPYEFYYYSGFGPRWGKRRGGTGSGNGGGGEESKSGTQDETFISGNGNNKKTDYSLDNKTASLDDLTNGGLDYIEDDDDDEEVDQDNIFGKRRKRARKPVKARSLKSLM